MANFVDSRLSLAFEQTIYYINELHLAIVVGIHNEKLKLLLDEHRQQNWAIITAVNPQSKVLSSEENQKRFGIFLKSLESFTCFKGVALDPYGNWPPEQNLLIFGISADAAVQLGQKWDQHAILFGKKGSPGELLWCSPDVS